MAQGLSRSPLAPDIMPDLSSIAGAKLACAASGSRYQGRDDLMLLLLQPGSKMAGVFTQSSMHAAPVEWSRDQIDAGHGLGVLVNAGNANAFTGSKGHEAVAACVSALHQKLVAHGYDIKERDILTASTGVIGEPLETDALITQFEGLISNLDEASWQVAAHAIRTTDTFAKGASLSTQIDGATIHITGIAKGSGMIAPNMATMLGFIATDANLSQSVLQACLCEVVETSFNAITVDSDTSTSDMVLLGATGAADHDEITDIADPRLAAFKGALKELAIDLAQQIVKDGEGASKFITIQVQGAADDAAAKRLGMAIGNSPLVKTAIAGEDANWGRIVMAVGKSGEKADRDKLQIAIGGIMIAQNGQRLDNYDEAPVAAHMKTDHIDILVDVGVGTGAATIWSCDLTHGYIEINADYRS